MMVRRIGKKDVIGMDESEVKRIVRHNEKKLIKELGLSKWDIVVKCESMSDRVAGGCKPDIVYKKAIIIIDPKLLWNEYDVIITLRHELLHCILSTFDTYLSALSKLLPEKVYTALAVMFNRANEEVVCDICRILEKLSSIRGEQEGK